MSNQCGFFASFLMFLGRIALSMVFLIAGYGKLVAFGATSAWIASKGFPHPDAFTVFAIIFELGGAILLFLGLFTRLGATLILLFLIPVSYFFHPFWTPDLPDMANQLQHFFKNLAIGGAMLYVIGAGGGRISLDALFRRNKCVKQADKQR